MGETKLTLSLLIVLISVVVEAATVGLELPKLKLSPNDITISGTSSGAMMAIQMQVAHSQTISGIASFAGGPYYCAKGSFKLAQDPCMKNPQSIDITPLNEAIKNFARLKTIDDPANLVDKKILIFSGNRDSVVRMEAAYRLKDQLESFQVKTTIRTDISAEHGFPTENYGNECDKLGVPWLQKCAFDGAKWTLEGLYGALNPKGSQSSANLQAFEQKSFAGMENLSILDSGLDEYGQIYIPASCRKASNPDCRLHIALHGCLMGPEIIEDKFLLNSGLNEWAETNKIVILYPAAHTGKLNPNGCWDWFGYTGEEYATKNGKQVRAIKGMIDRLIN